MTFHQSIKVTLISMTCYVTVVILLIKGYTFTWTPAGHYEEGAHSIQPPKIFVNSKDVCLSSNKRVFLLIMILSAVVNFERRNEIRATYANISQYQGCVIRHVFLLARIDYVEAQKMVREEYEKYKDIVQFDFDDNYKRLKEKTIGGLHWVNRTCRNAKYIIKTDDDMLILPQNAVRLIAGLSTRQQETLYSGRLRPLSRPQRRRGKWSVSRQLYPHPRYPPYVSGMGVVLSQDVVQKFLGVSVRIPNIHIEDAYLGLLAKASGIKPSCNTAVKWGFNLNNMSVHDAYCRFRNLMVIEANEHDMSSFWEGYSRAEKENRRCDLPGDYLSTREDICPWPWIASSDVLSLLPSDDALVRNACLSL